MVAYQLPDNTMPEMAPETHARLGLSYWKGLFGILGVLIGSLVAAPLFVSIGPVAMGAVVGSVGVATIYISLLGLRETDRPIGEPLRALAGLKATFQNKQLLILPLLLETFGYTHANPLGVRLAFPVMAVFILVGYLIFQRYRIGDTPEETRRNLNLAEA